MRKWLILLIIGLFFPSGASFAQIDSGSCNTLSYFNPTGQQVVYRHPVPTPWFAVRMTAEWVATTDTAFIGMGVDRAASSGGKADTLEVRILKDQLPTYYKLDELTILLPPNIQGQVIDAMYLVEFFYGGQIAWIDPPADFYLAWRVRGPAGDYARILMMKPALEPLRSVIINANNTTTLATDFMRSQLQLGSTDSVDFKATVHACWPYGVPVELTAFTARYADNAALLEWHTATEENNRGFIIERLAATSDIGMMNLWQRIGFVEGNGTTNLPQSYFFVDPYPTDAIDKNGVAHYRLRQMDYNGRFDVSPAVELAIPHDYSFALEQTYPNPANLSAASATVSFTLPEEQSARLELFDALGRSVRIIAEQDYTAGIHRTDISLNGLHSGVYFYRLTSGGAMLTRRMTVID
ncbi:MAG: T9SS type A sorting domain-containing protein [Bacteroidota bacterium]